MRQERLNLYLIDMKYIRNLHKADDKVSHSIFPCCCKTYENEAAG